MAVSGRARSRWARQRHEIEDGEWSSRRSTRAANARIADRESRSVRTDGDALRALQGDVGGRLVASKATELGIRLREPDTVSLVGDGQPAGRGGFAPGKAGRIGKGRSSAGSCGTARAAGSPL